MLLEPAQTVLFDDVPYMHQSLVRLPRADCI
jgi:hypothetical protein